MEEGAQAALGSDNFILMEIGMVSPSYQKHRLVDKLYLGSVNEKFWSVEDLLYQVIVLLSAFHCIFKHSIKIHYYTTVVCEVSFVKTTMVFA